MKIYRNKLYSISDAARRAGIAEHELRILISLDKIKYERQFGIHYIWGEEIPKIKDEWEYFNGRGIRYEAEQKEKDGNKSMVSKSRRSSKRRNN